MSTQKLPITQLEVGKVPANVLVCGDPARAEKIAAHFDTAELYTQKREYHSYLGSYRGTPMLVCSHGVGAAGAAIAFEELIAAGAKRIIRVGTCGGISPAVTDGHLVIATSAVANVGYVQEVVPPYFPAVADPHITIALQQAADEHTFSMPVHTGIVITRDAFYNGVVTANTPDYVVMNAANVLAVEMECAVLFVVGSLRGVQTGAILAADGNVLVKQENMDDYKPDRSIVADAVTAEIEIALNVLAGA